MFRADPDRAGDWVGLPRPLPRSPSPRTPDVVALLGFSSAGSGSASPSARSRSASMRRSDVGSWL
jgi:hypothetical protein